jgi:hypothetical protein
MDQHSIRYNKIQNAFLWIEALQHAQRFLNKLAKMKWPLVLRAFAHRFNLLLSDLLHPMQSYWIVEKAEYATDALFTNRPDLKSMYQELLKHATLSSVPRMFSPSSVANSTDALRAKCSTSTGNDCQRHGSNFG